MPLTTTTHERALVFYPRYIYIESSENPAAASLYEVTFILQFKMWRYAIGTIGYSDGTA